MADRDGNEFCVTDPFDSPVRAVTAHACGQSDIIDAVGTRFGA